MKLQLFLARKFSKGGGNKLEINDFCYHFKPDKDIFLPLWIIRIYYNF